MILKEYLEEALKSFDGYPGEVSLDFEICLDGECNVVMDSPNKVKFSVRTK